jgi:hypothetical protein
LDLLLEDLGVSDLLDFVRRHCGCW